MKNDTSQQRTLIDFSLDLIGLYLDEDFEGFSSRMEDGAAAGLLNAEAFVALVSVAASLVYSFGDNPLESLDGIRKEFHGIYK